jgi:protein TonB
MRIAISTVLGIITSFGLFWVMQALVGVTGELKEAGNKLSIEFVRLRLDKNPETKKREPPKREKPQQQPTPPPMNMAKNMNPAEGVTAIVSMMDTDVDLTEATSLGAGGSDRDVVPLVEIDPEYPQRAQARKIEGYVDVEYTVTAMGTVADAKVIGSKPPYIFDRSALNAIRRWKYKPKIKDGVAVPRIGMQIRLHFKPT